MQICAAHFSWPFQGAQVASGWENLLPAIAHCFWVSRWLGIQGRGCQRQRLSGGGEVMARCWRSASSEEGRGVGRRPSWPAWLGRFSWTHTSQKMFWASEPPGDWGPSASARAPPPPAWLVPWAMRLWEFWPVPPSRPGWPSSVLLAGWL